MQFVALTFFAVAAIVFGAYWFFIAGPEARQQAALRRRLKSEQTALARLSLTREPETLSEISAFNALLLQFGNISGPLHDLIDESGLRITVGTFVLMTITAFLLAAVVVQYYLQFFWASLAAGVVGSVTPTMVVRFMRSRRFFQFEEQFPEAIELIGRALRAGHGFATGLKVVGDEMPAPVGPEFKRLFEQQNYGAQIGDALRAFAQRIQLLDARFFVTAVLTQRETGGNLAEVLDRLAAVMRERFKVKREVRVRSAHGRLSAYVLAALPPSLAGMMMIINPDQMRLMVTDPLGRRMLVLAAALQIVGTLIVRKLVDIRY
jgi:tight adherence protein B